MPISCHNLISITDLTLDDVQQIFETARGFREVLTRPLKKVPTLRGRSVVNLFFEPSTRTRSSFELAAKRLSADAVNFTPSSSSLKKGESLADTGLSLEAMFPDIIVVRHPDAGAPGLLARRFSRCRIINAGDGMNEHPTQALLDAFTILERKGTLEGLRVAIVGDISHSRVARSNVLLMRLLGCRVTVCGPPTLIPVDYGQYDVRIVSSLKEAITGADVIMLLRSQKERQHEVFYPSNREYFTLFGMDQTRLDWAAPEAVVMHPGPINRGVEIDPRLADSNAAIILDQVSNGVAIRMALLYLFVGSGEDEE